ncbi:Riboflavin transporter [Marinovum algicola]|uniref:S-adenosylmethionine uptake transporter n=2 Tax=Marinovum algicola TaxID=42444 RepID=A0A975WBW5_9RHOB|nr:DMT family transporter [Marinovum algicola]SEJ83220.1 S-adenosylmethionine uptake transporter [Marinovum algicola]SLN62458.1 Riboflavin transporter [Marinovum algicola]
MRGVLFMLAGFFFYATSDSIAKVLTQSLHPVQVVWTRQFGLFCCVILLLARHGTGIMRTRHHAIQIARGVTAVGASISFVFAVTYIPLADAMAIAFVAPFFVTVLGALVLGEPIGMRRWIAVAIGFAGMLIIVRPGLGVLHPASVLPILAAAFFAARQVLSRMISGDDGSMTTVAYTAISAVTVLTLPLPFFWAWPNDPVTVALLGVIAVTAGLAEFLIVRALELAQAVVVAPTQYTVLIWGTMWGFLIFDQLPDGWTLAGAAIIMASGLYTLHREARAGSN